MAETVHPASRSLSKNCATVRASALALHVDCSRTYIGKLEAEGVIQRKGDSRSARAGLPTSVSCGASTGSHSSEVPAVGELAQPGDGHPRSIKVLNYGHHSCRTSAPTTNVDRDTIFYNAVAAR